MSDITETILYCGMLESLDSAFIALQGKKEWNPRGWGEAFFTALKEEHPEWALDMASVYEAARRMLLYYSIRRLGDEFSGSLFGNPRGFVETVLHFVEGPAHTLN